jgi:divalent metal cation (Fe/Co/Zn/Cd) transporter
MTDNASMTEANVSRLQSRVLQLQAFTIIWMSLEAVVSAWAAWSASSSALLAFGGDSAIELFSAALVFWRFRSPSNSTFNEKRAANIAGGLLFVLAAFVIVTSGLALVGDVEPKPSIPGIVVLVLAAIVMPLLASQKRKLAVVTASASLRADAAESALCGYMSWISLAGLTVNAVWGKSWADPIAALALTPFIMREGWEAVRMSRLGCQCGTSDG